MKKCKIGFPMAVLAVIGTLAFGQDVKVSAPGVYPIVNKPVTLRALVPQRLAGIPDWSTNKATLFMEKQTGVKLVFDVAPDFAQALSLAIASGDLPDIIFSGPVNSVDIMKYGSKGIFLPLNKMIEKQGINTKKMFQADPWVKQVITTPDGNIYGLPMINDDVHGVYGAKIWINKVWLDNLKLNMPTTTEEFFKVLKAFKTMDPNKNGLADEIPYTAAMNGWHGTIPGAVLNAFLPVNTNQKGMYVDKGVIKSAYMQDAYREGLKYHAQLFAEGLIDPSAFSQKVDQLRQVMENSKENIIGVAGGSWWSEFSINGGASGRYKDYVLVPPLTGPKGVRSSGFSKYAIAKDTFVITKACKYPEVAFQWADYMMSMEGGFNVAFGPENFGWKKTEPGSIAISGKPAMFERLLPQEATNFNWGFNGPAYFPQAIRTAERRAEGEDVWLASKLMTRLVGEMNAKMVGVHPPEDTIMPPVYLTEKQASEIKLVETSIVNLVNESAVRFITGNLSLDKDWDGYIANLKKAGIDKWLLLYQDAYKNQFGKK